MNALTKAVPPAPLVSPDGGNIVFLLGAPRSGTTWLAKIFDSHPDVVYRHEPDTVLRNDDVPYLCTRDDVNKYRDAARDYLIRLMDIRTLKSAGSLPLFVKHFRGPVSERLRAGIVYSLHAADTVSRRSPWPRRITIPDLIAGTQGPRPTFVFKSISSRGRMRLFGEALPKSKIIFILRHPCGQVASTMQGISKGKFERNDPFKAVLVLEEAKKLGMTADRFAALSPVEQCAWHWAILNQKALNDLASLSPGRAMVIRYEDACADPMRLAKELLDFAGLDWNKQTGSFVAKSTSAGDTNEFYGTSRDPMRAANKWRSTLAVKDQERILEIAAQVPAGQMFIEMTAS